MTDKLIEDRYLGDGVYASFDGYHIVLDLRGQDDTTSIALEPSVLLKLVQYASEIEAEKNIDAAQADADREMFGDDAGFEIPWGNK